MPIGSRFRFLIVTSRCPICLENENTQYYPRTRFASTEIALRIYFLVNFYLPLLNPPLSLVTPRIVPVSPQDMSRLDHRLLTSPTAVLDVDFLEAGAILMAPPIQTSLLAAHVRHALLPLPVQLSGRADAIAVWFDLYLDGEREDRDVVSTRSERRSRGDASGWVSQHVNCFSGFCRSVV